MGGMDEFCDYSQHYYGIKPSTSEDLDLKIAAENLNAFNSVRLEESQNKPIEPLHICITNASSPLAYQLASRIVLNEVFDQKIHLHLLYNDGHLESVQALAMELQDLAHHKLAFLSFTDSPQEAFKAVSAVFVLDEFSNRANEVEKPGSALTPSDPSNNVIEIIVSNCGDQVFGTSSQSDVPIDSLQLKSPNIEEEQRDQQGMEAQETPEFSKDNGG